MSNSVITLTIPVRGRGSDVIDTLRSLVERLASTSLANSSFKGSTGFLGGFSGTLVVECDSCDLPAVRRMVESATGRSLPL